MKRTRGTACRSIIVAAVAVSLSAGIAGDALATKNTTGRWDGRSLVQGSTPARALRAIADDPGSSRQARAKAVFSLFATYLRPPQGARAVSEVLSPARWLEDARLEGVYTLGGWIPVELGDDDTVFCLRLFPDKQGRSDWVIYFRLSGGTRQTADAARAFLRDPRAATGKITLVEFALCFPEAGKERVGRIERFSVQGIAVYPPW